MSTPVSRLPLNLGRPCLLDVIDIPAAVSVADQICRRIERGNLPLTAPRPAA